MKSLSSPGIWHLKDIQRKELKTGALLRQDDLYISVPCGMLL